MSSSTPREERRFLEAHPELINPEIDAIVEHLIADFQTHAPDIQQEMEMTPAQIAWLLQEQYRLLKLLRKIRTLSCTTEAIRATYVDTQGGFVLDVPTWLAVVEQQLNTLRDMRQPDQTAMERAELLRSVIAQALNEDEIAEETVAELYCLLWEALNDIVAMNKGQIVEEQIACLEEALQIYSRERYPFQYARVQHNLGNSYCDRIEGKKAVNLEEAINCYARALEIRTPDALPADYAKTQNSLGNAYRERVRGERGANLEEAFNCFYRASQILTLDTSPEDYAMIEYNLGLVYRERSVDERRINQERAMVCFHHALQVYTQDAFPLLYAATQHNLGDIYSERIEDERYANLEEAIACYIRAVQVYTLYNSPKEFAATQVKLGNIYLERILGERQWTNVEEAITCYQNALQVFTPEVFPEDYANTMLGLGHAYRTRAQGSRRVNLEEALTCISCALQVLSPEDHPNDYARAQTNLGIVFCERIEGERRANLEEAIACFSRALQIYTPEVFTENYAKTQQSLGNAYMLRVSGEEADNLEKAIACYTLALQIFTLNSFPLDYARTQVTRGNAFSLRILGEKLANQEEAIVCYKRALQVFTLSAFPVDYATAQNNLGNLYRDMVVGERSSNLEEAIACYTHALQVFTPATFPMDYAMVQRNLGDTYMQRIKGEHQANLKEGLGCYNRALNFYTLDAFPQELRSTQLDRAIAEAEQQNWEGVHSAYTHALAAENLLLALGAGALGRDAILKAGGDAAVRDAYALIRLLRIPEAAVTLESGRARGLAEALAMDAAEPSRISDRSRRARYEDARERFITAQAALHVPPDLDTGAIAADPATRAILIDQSQRNANLVRTAAYHQAKVAFDAVVAEIRAAQDPPDFLNTAIEPAMILSAAERGGQGHALVYLAATPWGGIAVAALGTHATVREASDFAVLELPQLTSTLVSDLGVSMLDSTTKAIIGGFGLAQAGEGLGWILQNWRGVTFRDSATLLRDACMASGKISTLDLAAQAILTDSRLTYVVDQALYKLSPEDLNKLDATLDHLFLHYELERCLPILADIALHALVIWLQKLGVTSVTLIPCGWLAGFPLGASEVSPQKTMSDLFATSMAPNARSLLGSKHMISERSGVYALGDPRPTHQGLQWCEAEAHTLVKLARHLGLFAEARVQGKATRSWLIEALQKGCIVDASCHGTFNIPEPLQSALALAQHEDLTLGDVLSQKVDLRGLRLLILSACQTAVLDLRGARDEVRSLAAGMLQAGAMAVLASLWSVDDKATYLLMVRFAQEWFSRIDQEPPAAALAQAQRWLRTVTNRELQTWRATSFPTPTIEEKREAGAETPQWDPWLEEERELGGPAKLVAVRGRGNRYDSIDAESLVHGVARRQNDPDACPFADPIYWAGFQINGW